MYPCRWEGEPMTNLRDPYAVHLLPEAVEYKATPYGTVATILTEAARVYGESNPYIGDDGRVYI